jgi:hypothetical protein
MNVMDSTQLRSSRPGELQLLEAVAAGLASWREGLVFGARRHIYRLLDSTTGGTSAATEQISRLVAAGLAQRTVAPGQPAAAVFSPVTITPAGLARLQQLQGQPGPPCTGPPAAQPAPDQDGLGDNGNREVQVGVPERQLLSAIADGIVTWEANMAVQVERNHTYRLHTSETGYQVVTRQAQRLIDSRSALCDTSESYQRGTVKLTQIGRSRLVQLEEQDDQLWADVK